MSNFVKSNYYTIPYHDNYEINTNGKIRNKETGEFVKTSIIYDQLCVEIDNDVFTVAQLMMLTFIGPLPGVIFFKDDDYTNCRTDNIGYLLNIYWEDPTDLSSDVIINGERFKLAAYYDSRYYLSEYGVLYDRNYNTVRPHSFSQREYWSVVINEGWDTRDKRMISRWVYETWIGPIPEGYQIDHKDAKQMNTTHSIVYGVVSGRAYKSYLKKLESESV